MTPAPTLVQATAVVVKRYHVDLTDHSGQLALVTDQALVQLAAGQATPGSDHAIAELTVLDDRSGTHRHVGADVR